MKRLIALFAAVLIFGGIKAAALDVSASGAVVINGATGGIIWEKDSRRPLSMASTTKIMTALLLCEQGGLSRTLVATSEMVAVEGSSMGLLPGDIVSRRDLLYGMMLSSGNDAANASAIAVGGSVSDFVRMMNAKAAEIGLEDTLFVTPSGLDAAGHHSTALDMARLARYALKNPDFRQAAESRTATLYFGNPPYKRTVKNHNRLLENYEGLIGVKTGYTKKSGRCLVTAAERGGALLVAATLCDPNDWLDHTKMLDFGFSALKPRTLDCALSPVPAVSGVKPEVEISADAVDIFLTDDEFSRVKTEIYLPRFLYCEVKSGERVGRVDYILDGEVIASSPVTASENIPRAARRSVINQILSNCKMLLKAMI